MVMSPSHWRRSSVGLKATGLHPQLHPSPTDCAATNSNGLLEAQNAAHQRMSPGQLHPNLAVGADNEGMFESESAQANLDFTNRLAQHAEASARMVPQVTYRAEIILGKGSFGTVFRALISGTNDHVAIKAVKHRMGEVNIEGEVLWKLRGEPNIVNLLGSFSTGGGENHILNLVLEYLPDTLQRIIKHHRHLAMMLDTHYVRLYMFQLLRGLAVLDRHGIVHRDLKPANLLVEPRSKMLKICDFGTAMPAGGPGADMQFYVCSRYYRAPELILSSGNYGPAIDRWSAGCVLAEMFLGQPLFPGKDGVDQFGQMVAILGTPTQEEVRAMNPEYAADVKFKNRVEPLPFEKVMGRDIGFEAMELLGHLLQYNPAMRPLPLDTMTAMFFEPLWQAAPQMDPFFFDLSVQELSHCQNPNVQQWLYSACNAARQAQHAAAQTAAQQVPQAHYAQQFAAQQVFPQGNQHAQHTQHSWMR